MIAKIYVLAQFKADRFSIASNVKLQSLSRYWELLKLRTFISKSYKNYTVFNMKDNFSPGLSNSIGTFIDLKYCLKIVQYKYKVGDPLFHKSVHQFQDCTTENIFNVCTVILNVTLSLPQLD